MFQDDQRLVYPPLSAAGNATVKRTLSTLRSLGVQEIRVMLSWAVVAPDPKSATPPRFDAFNPGAYPAGAWLPYDRLDLFARRYGIAVELDAGPPAPVWATRPSPVAHYALTGDYGVNASEFGAFVQAAGVRYDGRFRAVIARGAPAVTLPRVSHWSVWNEPNQPGWLAPQWRLAGGRRVPDAPRLYRSYLDAAWSALAASGHTPATDTILFAETAPEGCARSLSTPCPGFPFAYERPMTALAFVRALYCVDRRLRPLRGAAAGALGCPPSGGTAAFVTANPALFDASGYAHHPYDFAHAPAVSLPESDFVPLSGLGRLERTLHGIFAAYGVHRQLPIWLTEYGYETDPPNVCRGVSLADQAVWLDEAQYMAWRDQRVRALSQFLLVDSAPDSAYPPTDACRYWSTFQTGLEFLSGRRKPSFIAYRLPLWLPAGGRPRRGRLRVWALLRVARGGRAAPARVQWRGPGGRWRALATVRASPPADVLQVTVAVPRPGRLRIAWPEPDGKLLYSRSAGVR
jgi:hypothetical protein